MQHVLVLLVEDEPIIRLELQDVLEEGGYTVLLAGEGGSGVSCLDTDDRIRGLITDINLGGDVSGWDVARHARQLHPDIPVVYVSSTSSDEWSVHGVPRSILVHKPFAPAQVLTAISQLLNAAEPDGPPGPPER